VEAEIRHKPINWMEWFAHYTYTNSEIFLAYELLNAKAENLLVNKEDMLLSL
jgi:hypothetical protein